MTRSKTIWITLLVPSILTFACIGSAIPTTSPNALNTIIAGTMLAITPIASPTEIEHSFVLPTTTSITILPPLGPTSLPAITRINFLTNATTGVVRAPIQAEQQLNFVLQASQAQPMIIRADSAHNDVTISLRTQGGTSMLNTASHTSSWQGVLPQTEDYVIGVYGGEFSEDFTLTIEIASRIKFAVGTSSEKLKGETVAGYRVAYAIFAIEGQKMSLDLIGAGSEASLAIFGFKDGQPYLQSDMAKSNFTFKLPSTQDYIVEVVPQAGKFINYTLVVTVQ